MSLIIYKFKIVGKITTLENNIISNTVDLMEPQDSTEAQFEKHCYIPM